MNDVRSAAARRVGTNRSDLLGSYLSDHLAGPTVGTRRAAHLARSLRGSPYGAALGTIAAEITEDRATLPAMMRKPGVPARRYKVLAGGALEPAGRLKSNGRLIGRSPLTTLLELELLRLGVEGEAAARRSLRRIADSDRRLEPERLDQLIERAQRQLRVLEDLRLRQSQQALPAT
ncbi:hypothetical protein [Streptomyces gibsoniae]|uniref:Uncharacterized protein n=1 Tax=Streptomyces gibsoniae TaxID=3075529 RepID=A0ABU2TT27_9ACTN|nr:hypothetical protein [Streptomyces sp. DSM 41699]MDT0464114.1 hypothetical protein [Streptomyces sp. DSM 41699]